MLVQKGMFDEIEWRLEMMEEYRMFGYKPLTILSG
jgi:hypothetical protein